MKMVGLGGELISFLLVWISIVALLCYCYKIGKLIHKGTRRFLAILPVVCIFLVLPLCVLTFSLRGLTSFFLSWLANFRLLSFAFDEGPLSPQPPHPPLSLIHFIALACLPIKFQKNTHSTISQPDDNDDQELVNLDDDQDQDIEKLVENVEKQDKPSQEIPKKGLKSPLNYAAKFLLLVALGFIYTKEDHLHPKVMLLLYVVHVYIALELILAMLAAVVRACLGVELEPQFDEPYLASSLQDFWGKRWNLIVTSILRPIVYKPIHSVSCRCMSKKWAPLTAVMSAFLVSGLMHELIFYQIGRQKPTGEVTCFFLLHGFCLTIEIAIKQEVNGTWRLPRVVAAPLVVGFVVVTTVWLFMPTVVRCKIDVEARREAIGLINFVKAIYIYLTDKLNKH